MRFHLRRVVHPDLQHVSFTGGGKYAGLWILDARGAVLGSALRLEGAGHRPYAGSPDALTAGTYTVYLVGDGPVSARIPLGRGEAGLALTVTRPTTASYTETKHVMPATESEATVRLPVPRQPAAMGYAGGFLRSPPRAVTEIDVCLPRRDATCRHHVDPEYAQQTQLGDGGYYGSSFGLSPSTVAEERDVLVSVEAHSTQPTVVTAWRFTVRLS